MTSLRYGNVVYGWTAEEASILVNPLQELIQRRMRTLGVTSWSELGRLSGLPRSTVWALGTTERRTTLPKDATLDAVAQALGVTVEELRQAAYDSLGPAERMTDELGGDVRVCGSDFHRLSQEDQDELNTLVLRLVQEKRLRLRDGAR